MKKFVSIIFQFLLLISLFLLNNCTENPISQINNYSPFPGKFHGTWIRESDSIHISFDSTSMRFLAQAGYDFGIRREFSGNFTIDSSTLVLNYDDGSKSQLRYSFDHDTLLLSTPSWKYTRIETSPNNVGWSTKPSIISEQTFFIIGGIRAYSYSDSVAIILAPYNTDELYLTMLNIKDGISISTQLSNGVHAVDAVGSFLWVATDSTIEKRTLFDSTTLFSFSYREAVGSSYFVSGIAIDNYYCYLMTVNYPDGKGILLKFNLSGDLLSSVQTSSVIRDLCLVNNRLFCVIGDETFIELNPSTGYVITNYDLPDRSIYNNIDGIAFTGSTIQLAYRKLYGKLCITEIGIPLK